LNEFIIQILIHRKIKIEQNDNSQYMKIGYWRVSMTSAWYNSSHIKDFYKIYKITKRGLFVLGSKINFLKRVNKEKNH